MNSQDLDTLDLWSEFPAEHRLAGCIDASLAGENYEERKATLAAYLGYSRPSAVSLWLDHTAIVPIRHLPHIATFIGIDLAVLTTFWVATYAADEDEAGVIAKSIEPVRRRIT